MRKERSINHQTIIRFPRGQLDKVERPEAVRICCVAAPPDEDTAASIVFVEEEGGGWGDETAFKGVEEGVWSLCEGEGGEVDTGAIENQFGWFG